MLVSMGTSNKDVPMLIFRTAPISKIPFCRGSAFELTTRQTIWSVGIGVIMCAFVDGSKVGRTVVTFGINAIEVTIHAAASKGSTDATFGTFFA